MARVIHIFIACLMLSGCGPNLVDTKLAPVSKKALDRATSTKEFSNVIKFSDFDTKTLCKNIELYDNSSALAEA